MINKSFDLNNEFKSINFQSKKLEKRFKKTMVKLEKQPDKSILSSTGSRSEAKAVYRMLDNEKFEMNEILNSHKEATIERIINSDNKIILAVQDTMSVNYSTHIKTKGLGYNCDKSLGINVHSCLALTEDGIALGVLYQSSYTREERKTEHKNDWQKRRRPIEEKESYRWLETMEESNQNIPDKIKVINICDREGDMYELFEKAIIENRNFLIRIVQNRVTINNEKIIDDIRRETIKGTVEVTIPRDSRNNIQERTATLGINFKSYEIKVPAKIKREQSTKTLKINVIYVKEQNSEKEPIEWILMTNEAISSYEEAFIFVNYYIQRWKIERFHYVLKSGCNIEKIQQRDVEKIIPLILMYSIISVMILNMTYLSRLNPELPCSAIFDEEEWKTLYCISNKTKLPPSEAYSINEAIKYISELGGYKAAKSDGPPGLKVVWIGLSKLLLLLDYKSFL